MRRRERWGGKEREEVFFLLLSIFDISECHQPEFLGSKEGEGGRRIRFEKGSWFCFVFI